MEQQLSTLNTTEPIDYDNLNIITHPPPPRRRQSGTSLVPFRPYVKRLTGIREPFGYADGFNEWKTIGQRETFFKQENARCIGTLIDDCDISDVIRWDIQGESTRLPMMCKLWMIVDGAVVERGKPHLVQDAAIQVFTTGRNRRAILAAEQRYGHSSMSSFDRRRRHSWHDVNEYHSVPYYQYTHSIRSGYQNGIQCDLDNEHVTSTQEYLPFVLEETVEEDEDNLFSKQTASATVHNQTILQDRVKISIMTQTEKTFEDHSTEIEDDFLILFNLNIQTNENLLSSLANSYQRETTSDISSHRTSNYYHGRKYNDQSVATGDDFPQWWLQLSTNVLLSNQITNQGEEKKNLTSLPSPRQQLDQSIQTDNEPDSDHDIDKTRPPSSTRSSRIQKSSSSITVNDNYEIIDQTNDGNNSQRNLSYHCGSRQELCNDSDCYLSGYNIEISSRDGDSRRYRRRTNSSKQSDSGYHTLASNINQQSYSTPESSLIQTQRTSSIHSSTNDLHQRQRTKSFESSSTIALNILLERYKRTLKEREHAIAIINDQFLDIDDVLKRYRTRINNSERAIELHRDISELSTQSKQEISIRSPSSSSSLVISRVTKNKYRTMPEISSEEMLEGYIPSPQISLINDSFHHQRQPRFDYCELCLNDSNTSSAWIRYNEQRIEQLQKRIDLLLEIDDQDESPLLFSTETVTQCIDDILTKKPRRRNSFMSYHTRILLPRRYNFRYPYRPNPSLPTSSRLLTRNLTRSNHSIRKSVRISTIPDPIRLREPSKLITQPIVSILRRPTTTTTTTTLRPSRFTETSHIWRDETEGKVYILKQFSIPRYYRLYNDVSFREIYNFSRILESYLNRTTSDKYSSIIKRFAIEQQLPTITSVA